MTRSAYACVLALIFAVGCGQNDPAVTLISSQGMRGASLAHDERMRLPTTPGGLGVNQHAITVGDGPNGEQILYVNFDGAAIKRVTNPNDDSATNTSWIPDTVGIGGTVSVPAFDAAPFAPTFTAAAARQQIATMVTDYFASYNLLVTTTRPSAGTQYTMVVVGGQTGQVIAGPEQGTVGVAPVDCTNSSQIEIAFAFSATLVAQNPPTNAGQRQQVLAMIAQTIAHEAGHSFGLKHVNNTADIMYPSVDVNVQGFLGAAAYSEPGQNQCQAGPTQDTNQVLLTNLGPAPSGPALPKPNVSFFAPMNGSTVPYTFTASVNASQPAGAGGTITKVELVESAVTQATYTAPPYQTTFEVDSTVPNGTVLRFTAIAYNSLGGKASVSSQFTVSSSGTQGPIPCALPTDCRANQSCTGGVCVDTDPNSCTPACKSTETCVDGECRITTSLPDLAMDNPGTSAVGSACEDSSVCGTDGVCAQAGDKKYCTVACDPGDPASCPADYQCAAVGADHYCGPKSGGCSLSGPGSSSLAPVWMLGLCALFLRRRRLLPSAT